MTKITPLDSWIKSKTGLRELNEASVREYHLTKLQQVFQYVKTRSRFYRELLQRYGDFTTFEDFSKLPFTYPSDISADPYAFVCVPPDQISRVTTLRTSATTGNSKRIMFTSDDQELTIDFFSHGMSAFTEPGDKVLIFMPGDVPGGVGNLLVQAIGRLRAHSRVYGPINDYNDAQNALNDYCPNVVVGFPSQVHRLAMETAGVFHASSVLLASDYMSPSLINTVSECWDCDVFTHYGLTETGLGGAVSCHARTGYHIRENDLYVEIIDPSSGLPAAVGESGEVVISTLNHNCMPLLRYRTGDRSRILARQCACGSSVRRLDRITGRINEPLRLQSGKTLSIGTLDDIIYNCSGVAAYSAQLAGSGNHGTVHDGRDGAQETLIIKILLTENSTALPAAALIQELGSLPVKVDIRFGEPDFFTTGATKRRIDDLRINTLHG